MRQSTLAIGSTIMFLIAFIPMFSGHVDGGMSFISSGMVLAYIAIALDRG